MSNLKKELLKCKHPNSRKTISLAKKNRKETYKQDAKLGQMIKQNIIGEKIKWFQQHITENVSEKNVYNKEDILVILNKYLSRFDEELSQIAVKNSIGGRKKRQHASREDVIKMTKQREVEEQQTCGLEIPDLSNSTQVSLLKHWNGELRFLSNFKLKRFPNKFLVS